MAELTDEERKELQKRQDNLLAQLKKRPYDLVLHAGLTYTAALLSKYDTILDQCAELFYNDPTNTAFLEIYTLMMEQNIQDGNFDLVKKHKEKFEGLEGFFEDYLARLEIACGKQIEESDALSCKEKLETTIIFYEELVEILENPNLRPTNNTPPEPQ